MVFRDLRPQLFPNSAEPLAVQLVRLVAREILDGRLLPGSALPGSRSLAEDLGLSRHVVMTAFMELEAEGWVESRSGSGTYVADRLPGAIPRHWGPLPQATAIPDDPPFELPAQLLPVSTLQQGTFDLSEGMPDVRLAPKEELAKGYQRAIRRHGDQLLGAGEARGNQALREQLAEHLTGARGFKVGPDQILLTRGLSDALSLVSRALIPTGGGAAVENPGNPSAWEALRGGRDLCLHALPVDGEGLQVEALERLLDAHPIALVHVSPHRQHPTQVVLSPLRRAKLLSLANRHGFAVVEEDPEFEFHGPEGPVLPLASADGGGVVIHLGSFSQLLAPGLGLGFLVAPRNLVDRLARMRKAQRIQGDRVLEWAVADLMRDGDLERHLARARKAYQDRKAEFLTSVGQILGPGFLCADPPGGLACWMRVPEDLDTDVLANIGMENGIKIRPGRHYDFHRRSLPFLLLGFAHLNPAEAREALSCLRGAVEHSQRSRLA